MATYASFDSVLVAGGCGLLGSHIVNTLIDQQLSPAVSVLDISDPGEWSKRDGVTYYKGDISDEDFVQSVVSNVRPQVVFHTASPPPFRHDFQYNMAINHAGTGYLLKSSEASGCQAFVYTSSSSVVHDSLDDLDGTDESAPVLYWPKQREAYHHSKAMAETRVLEANHSPFLTCALRPSGIFGPGDTLTVPTLIMNAKEGKQKFQIGDNKNLFDWTFVHNAVHAHLLAATKLLAAHHQNDHAGSASAMNGTMRVDGEAFFITNDEHIPFWDFARGIGSAARYPTDPGSIWVIPKYFALSIGFIAEWIVWLSSLGRRTATFNRRSLKYSTLNRTSDISKARERLGYTPQVTVHEGIQRSVLSFRQPSKKDI